MRRTDSTGVANPLTGLVYCADCGKKMFNHKCAARARKDGREADPVSGLHPFDHYNCATYYQSKHREQPECTGHYINTHVLRALILDAIRLASKYAIANQDEFMRKVREASSVRQAEAAKDLKRRLGKAERRVKELDTLLKKLYESYAMGKLPEKRYELLSADYEREQTELEQFIEAGRNDIAAFDDDTDRAGQFLALAKKYTDFSVLTTPMINEFIDRIVVHAPDKLSRAPLGLSVTVQQSECYR